MPSSLVIFASSRFSEIPIEQVSPVSCLDLRGDPAHRRLRREEAGEVEVGLVEADDLDRLGVGPQDRHHLARGLAIGGEVGLDVDRVGEPRRAVAAGIAEWIPASRRAS